MYVPFFKTNSFRLIMLTYYFLIGSHGRNGLLSPGISHEACWMFKQALDEVRHSDNEDPTRRDCALKLHCHPLHHRQLPQQNIEVIGLSSLHPYGLSSLDRYHDGGANGQAIEKMPQDSSFGRVHNHARGDIVENFDNSLSGVQYLEYLEKDQCVDLRDLRRIVGMVVGLVVGMVGG